MGKSNIIIYHNGQCTKSVGALELLQEQKIPHTVRWYLADPLSKAELKALLDKLGMEPSELVRTSEPLFLEKYEHKQITEAGWLDVLLAHPELMQRPIVANGDKAVVARPAERALEII